MSLVAYGASDESDISDTEVIETIKVEQEGVKSSTATVDNTEISDEEDYKANGVQTLLNELPTSKQADVSPTEGEDELEEEVKAKPSELVYAPKPPASCKVKQPARIMIPELKPDPEEEEDVKRKLKKSAAVSVKGSGLFSLLPPPVHTAKKEINRSLVPYALTKRPALTKTVSHPQVQTAPSASQVKDSEENLPSQKRQSAFNALTGYESDSDDEESSDANFFSLNSSEGSRPEGKDVTVLKGCDSLTTASRLNAAEVIDGGDKEKQVGRFDGNSVHQSEKPLASDKNVNKLDEEADTSSKTLPLASSLPDTAKVKDEDDKESGSSEEEDTFEMLGVPTGDQDAPLSFSSTIQRHGWSTSPLITPMLPEMYAAKRWNVQAGASNWQSQQHEISPHDNEDVTKSYMEQDEDAGSSADVQQYLADEQFLRLGGKRKRSAADIHIVDAVVDDCVDPNDLMKGISEESAYQPHRKKENLPSSQQRRKKQIHYLAFQAKERELELKNAWAANKMTKSHARSKYGF